VLVNGFCEAPATGCDRHDRCPSQIRERFWQAWGCGAAGTVGEPLLLWSCTRNVQGTPTASVDAVRATRPRPRAAREPAQSPGAMPRRVASATASVLLRAPSLPSRDFTCPFT